MTDQITNITFITFVVVFLGGVMTSFTPCAYPLIPIIAGVVGSSREQSKLRNFILSLCYVLGMAITFSILGIVAALTGRFFGQVQSSPVAHLIVGSVIIIFALSLLNVIHLPVFLLNRMGAGKAIKGGRLFPAFFMGITSGLIAAPCATAVLGAVLAYAASTQNAILGFSLLFTFAIGLGTLLIVVGTFTGVLAGLSGVSKWMKIVEKIMAFAMIALGCYFIFKAGALSV